MLKDGVSIYAEKEQNVKYDAMVEEMKANGYCDHCCNVILKYAANNLWKD